MTNESLLVICLVLIGVLAGVVAVLWFQLWLSRRDANVMRRLTFVTPAMEPPDGGGCLGSLLGWVVLLGVALLLLAAFRG
jgi:hypothetical protein